MLIHGWYLHARVRSGAHDEQSLILTSSFDSGVNYWTLPSHLIWTTTLTMSGLYCLHKAKAVQKARAAMFSRGIIDPEYALEHELCKLDIISDFHVFSVKCPLNRQWNFCHVDLLHNENIRGIGVSSKHPRWQLTWIKCTFLWMKNQFKELEYVKYCIS